MGTFLNSALTPEQKEARKTGLGASEISIIMGVNSYSTPWKLWRQKMGLDDGDPPNAYTVAGNMLEDAVAAYFEAESGHRVIKSSQANYRYHHPTLPLAASPDREYFEKQTATSKGSRRRIFEAKTTQMDVDKDAMPLEWFCQLQANLGIARDAGAPGMDAGSIGWLQRGLFFDYIEYDFDPHFYDEVKSISSQWWQLHIVEGIEPALTTAGDVMTKFPESLLGSEIQATEEITKIVLELAAVKEKRKEYETREEKLAEKVKLFMLDAERLCIDAVPLVTWKSQKGPWDVDNKKLAAEFPEVYDKVKWQQKGKRPLLVK